MLHELQREFRAAILNDEAGAAAGRVRADGLEEHARLAVYRHHVFTSLITALESIKGWENGILPPLTIGPDHETQKKGFWVKVEKQRFKTLTDWLKSE